MSDFITAGSEYNGQENQETILRPIFTGEDITAMGIRTILSVKTSIKLNFIDSRDKLLKVYTSGWQGGTASTKRQKKITLAEFKAEQEYSKQEYKSLIYYEVVNKGGINQNDISGTDIFNAEVQVFFNAIKSDIFRIFWLGDTTKNTLLAGGTYDDSTPDVDYNVLNGVWTAIIAVASTTPTLNQIKRIVIANGTVAQVDTVTLTGTSGTANLRVNSVNYLATFTANLTTSAANFVTSHAATLLALDIVVTSSGADVILTANEPGQPFLTNSILNVTTDLAGSIVLTTANTLPAALGTDEAKTIFQSMVTGADKKLKQFYDSTLVRLYVTDTMMENYQESLEADGTEQAHIKLIDGVTRFMYRGFPLIPMGIDGHLENDFSEPFIHRAILSMPTNLVLVLNGASDFAETRFWFNQDANENRQRTQFEFAADFVLPEMMVAAF